VSIEVWEGRRCPSCRDRLHEPDSRSRRSARSRREWAVCMPSSLASGPRSYGFPTGAAGPVSPICRSCPSHPADKAVACHARPGAQIPAASSSSEDGDPELVTGSLIPLSERPCIVDRFLLEVRAKGKFPSISKRVMTPRCRRCRSLCCRRRERISGSMQRCCRTRSVEKTSLTDSCGIDERRRVSAGIARALDDGVAAGVPQSLKTAATVVRLLADSGRDRRFSSSNAG